VVEDETRRISSRARQMISGCRRGMNDKDDDKKLLNDSTF
jgi:DNA-directed RNA polymerase subunit K/omega